jgi:predicted flap endonuclease-1-like 5' DNA nuclease
MNMGSRYHIDPDKIRLKVLQTSLDSRELIPSRKPLKIKLKERFDRIGSAGIETLGDLIKSVKNKEKLDQFSQETGIDIDYLTLLKREANSYFPNPVPLRKLPGISADVVSKMAEAGLNNTKQLFDHVLTEEDKAKLCAKVRIPGSDLEELYQLSDLSRLYGVGPVFARILYDSGINSVNVFVDYSAQEIINIYENVTKRRADFTLDDIQFSLDIAKHLE